MCPVRYLIPLPEARLMHLSDAEVPALLAHARGDAIRGRAELGPLRGPDGDAGRALPALEVVGDWWCRYIDEDDAAPADLDGTGASGTLTRALRAGTPIGGSTARYRWADEVRVVAAELAGIIQERDELLGCLHGPRPAEPPRETLFGDEIRRGEDLDGAEFDQLVAGLELLAAYYGAVAARGDALLIATPPIDSAAH